MKYKFPALIIKEEDGFVVEFPDLEDAFIDEIDVPTNATIALFKADTLEYRKLHDTRSVRKNVTIPSWLNTLAINKNINFSNLLQNALMNELGIENK